MAEVKPEGGMEDMGREGEIDPGLLAAADDILSAVAMKDSESLARALKAALEILDSQPMPDPDAA